MKTRQTTRRHAFTMIEMVMVIVVIGILAALAIPRMERDIRQEAADNILSAIRYTQHLALVDDKTDPFDGNWQQKLWMIQFYGGNDAYYIVGSDMNVNGRISHPESAIDPANGKYMYNTGGFASAAANNESTNVFLGHKYGINAVTPSGGCSSKHIAFDHLGRPHNGLATQGNSNYATNDYGTYMTSDCNLTFSFSDSSIDPLSIIITKETGYAYIDGQPDS